MYLGEGGKRSADMKKKLANQSRDREIQPWDFDR